MPVPILDLVVIGVVLISALLAAVRGVTREVLAIAAWVAAIAAAWFLHPAALPTAQKYIHNPQIALVAAIAAIFIVTLIVVSIVTVKVSDIILDSRIGALDRTLGFFFGAARGFLICAIGWVFLSWLLQGKNPDWAATSRIRPMLETTGDRIVALMPDNPEGLLQQLRKPSVTDTETSEPEEPIPQAAPKTAPTATAPAPAATPPAPATPVPGAPQRPARKN